MLIRPSHFTPAPEAAPAPAFDLNEAIAFAARRWMFMASALGLALLIAAIQLARTTPLYTATAAVLLDPKRANPIAPQNEAGPNFDLDYNISKIENEIAIIRSSPLMQRVVEKENLTGDPEFGALSAPVASSGLVATLKALLPFRSAPNDATPRAAPVDLQRVVAALSGAVDVKRTGFSSVLNISVISADPAKAARLANAVADAYAVDKLDARFDAAKRASAWLSDRLADMRRQLRESEEAVVAFRTEHGIVQTTGSLTISQEQLGQLNTRLMNARADTAEKKSRADLLVAIEAKGGSLQNLPDATGSATISHLRSQEADVSRREADLVARYGDGHPMVINVRAERRDVQRAINAEAQRLAGAIRNEYRLAKAREEAIEKSFNEATGRGGVDERTAITLKELERTAAVNKTLFEEFLQKSKITGEKATFEANDVRVMTPAQTPVVPTSPRKTQTFGVAALVGLLVGVAAALAIEKLNMGFTSVRQIEDLAHLPVLASVAHVAAADRTINGALVDLRRMLILKPLSRHAEAIRALRSGILMTDVDHPPKVVMVTSTAPSEGKTSVALMLAASAASSGQKVLVVDADLRRPSLSRAVGAEKTLGLVDLLLGETDAQTAFRFDEEGRHWILPAGGKTQNPPDLLGSEKMKKLIETARASFDYIVIDTPPVGPVIDAIVLSALVDKVAYVVKWGATHREAVADAIRRVGDHRKIAGIAFNMVNERRAQQYGRQGSAYYGGSAYSKYYVDH